MGGKAARFDSKEKEREYEIDRITSSGRSFA